MSGHVRRSLKIKVGTTPLLGEGVDAPQHGDPPDIHQSTRKGPHVNQTPPCATQALSRGGGEAGQVREGLFPISPADRVRAGSGCAQGVPGCAPPGSSRGMGGRSGGMVARPGQKSTGHGDNWVCWAPVCPPRPARAVLCTVHRPGGWGDSISRAPAARRRHDQGR